MVTNRSTAKGGDLEIAGSKQQITGKGNPMKPEVISNILGATVGKKDRVIRLDRQTGSSLLKVGQVWKNRIGANVEVVQMFTNHGFPFVVRCSEFLGEYGYKYEYSVNEEGRHRNRLDDHPIDLVTLVSDVQSTFTPSGTEARVIQMIAERQKLGINKYGTTVEGNPLSLRQWLQHALEESLDMAIYIQRVIEQLDQQQDDGK